MSESPFTGLMPFAEHQARFFFGRDADREIVTANLLASRLTVLYGPSGVGKSSLLNAGVAPHLRSLARRNLDQHGTSEFIVIVFGSWRDDPLNELARRVSQQVPEPVNGTFVEKLDAVSARLDCELLIILDQFEEFFLYHPHRHSHGAFARELASAVNRGGRPASFLISIREDSLATLDRFENCIPNVLENRVRIDHLDEGAAREAVRRPIERFNELQLNEANHVMIEDALVESVLEQVRTSRAVSRQAGHDNAQRAAQRVSADHRVETPYLQLVMSRLWDEERRAGSRVLRAETLTRMGGAARIIGTHLDAAMSNLTPAETDLAARVFNYLVTPSQAKIAHSLPDLANYADVTPDALAPLLQKLSVGQNRILTSVTPAPDQPAHLRYQILHDILAAPVLDWRTRYVQGRARAKAEAEAEAQRHRAEAEARGRARLRKLSVLLLVLVLATTGLATLAGSQMRKAEARRLEAEAAKLDSEAARHLAEAGRLELEAANKARDAAQRLAELNRLQAEAAKAELNGALERATGLRQRAAETKKQADTEEADSITLNRKAQEERRSAAITHGEVHRLGGRADQRIDHAGIDRALQKYRAAYASFDLDALQTVYPQLTRDRKKHLQQSQAACLTYEVTLSVLDTHSSGPDTVIVESQTAYQCLAKRGSVPSTFRMREDFWLRKDPSGAWIIDNITAPGRQ